MNANRKQRFAALPRIEAHEVGRPRFRVGNPIVAGAGDFEVQPIYDYYGVAAATATGAQRMFQVSQGQNHVLGGLNIIKTALHTSMTTAGGVLPNPERILVRCVCVFLDNRMNQVDVSRFINETLLTLTIGQKQYLQAGLFNFPAGGGAWLQSTNNAAGIAGNGRPSSQEGYKLMAPAGPGYPGVDGIEIAQGQNFAVVLDPTLATQFQALGTGFTTAAAGATPAGIGVHAEVYLHGTKLIAVQ